MNVTYFKRYRMEIDLFDPVAVPDLPDGFCWVPWDRSFLEVHAEVKYQSFHDEIDSVVFANLSCREGCAFLMGEIVRRAGFIPEATWLVACSAGYCGTVQGVRDRSGLGAIQNLGVLPAYRGHGLGRALLLKALDGFRRAGLGRAFLEVTARNEAAVRLYRRLGFRFRKTVYKAVDTCHVLQPALEG
jgi:ribosomal protein S18 acetylase RimI-like enzyme